MKTDIFIVTFFRDAPYIPYLLKSISKFCTGFSDVVLAVPDRDKEIFDGMGLTREKVKYYKEEGDGFIHHQGIKCCADTFCDGDFVLHCDADCLFTSPAKAEHYFVDGKPIVPMTPYASLNGCSPWQQCTERVLGFKVDMEFMRRHPSVYSRLDYGRFRQHVYDIHRTPLMDYLRPITKHTRKENSFSEFNALSGFMYERLAYKYHFMNTDTTELPDNHLAQWWSMGGVNWKMDHAPFEGQSFREVSERILK